jgi:NAD(P)-dependent dehydrogenase (short-subunit alcohol dehydrogenase family)
MKMKDCFVAYDGQPLKGKVALITGGSRGIGAAITRKLAAWGCTVCVNFVERERPARALAKELESQGVTVTLHQADVSVPEDIEQMMEDIRARYGDLHILVHNAAATKFSLLEDATLAHWQFVQDTNSRSTWLLAKHALPLMRDRPGARYIPITNSASTKIISKAGLFAVAKAGMETLTKYLSYELAPHGIVVNCVRPGLVRTGVFRVRPEFSMGLKRELAITPWRGNRTTTAADAGDVVAILCLDEAAWISGQVITVDGGFHLWGMRRGGSEPSPE